jgi:hypothetical protein
MARGMVRFGVELERELDVEFKKLADLEDRSKCNMHKVMVRRVIHLWKTNPDALQQLRIIQPQAQ